MLVLVENAAGYGLFKLTDSNLMDIEAEDLSRHFQDPSKPLGVELHAFSKFDSTKVAVEEATAIAESRIGSRLKKFIKSQILKKGLDDQLAVGDRALGHALKDKFGVDIVFNNQTHELIRGVRNHLTELVEGLTAQVEKSLTVSLAHSLNRFKIKFSPEKVDTMIIQAVGCLEDLDRELNNFAMRLKEWYGWHFPELAKIVTDNLTYAKIVLAIGMRDNTETVDLSEIVTEEIEEEIKRSGAISMGTEITASDIEHVFELSQRVKQLTEYRASLAEYLKFRMEAISPNLTHMVGELVGAKLISHAGSLMALAKHPSSTVQLLGAEKALFRALKNKTHTPKYGLIFQANIVGQAAPKCKGKISRVLAAKLSLCIRVDALGDQDMPTVAIETRRYVEKRLDDLQGDHTRKLSKSHQQPPTRRYEPKRGLSMSGEIAEYDDSHDVVGKKRRSEGDQHSGKSKKTKRDVKSEGEDEGEE